MEHKITEEQAAAILKRVEELTAVTAFKLALNPEKIPALCDTKFGGIPYWDTKQEYPNLLGEPLVMLAQINLRDLRENEYLPDHGLLQFFILPDDACGCNFGEPDANDTFCVIFHAEIDPVVTAEDVLSLNIPTTLTFEEDAGAWIPIFGKREFAVDVKKTTVSMGTECYEYDELVMRAARELGISISEHCSAYNLLPEKLFDAEFEKNTGHWLLGYPYFTQYDPRENDEKLRYYDMLLFQMDSDSPAGSNYEILWGDCGVANFFINRDDLKRLDFSKVMYTWDCC